MSTVEQLQTLAGEISATMRSNQGMAILCLSPVCLPQCILVAKAVTQNTENQPNLDVKGKFSLNFATHLGQIRIAILILYIEQQQFVADVERLTSDKADLLTRLQCCEEDLKTANECENCNFISYVVECLHFSIDNEG